MDLQNLLSGHLADALLKFGENHVLPNLTEHIGQQLALGPFLAAHTNTHTLSSSASCAFELKVWVIRSLSSRGKGQDGCMLRNILKQ